MFYVGLFWLFMAAIVFVTRDKNIEYDKDTSYIVRIYSCVIIANIYFVGNTILEASGW